MMSYHMIYYNIISCYHVIVYNVIYSMLHMLYIHIHTQHVYYCNINDITV